MQAGLVSRSLLLSLIVLSSITAHGDGVNSAHCNCGAQAPGDIEIGFIWPIHYKVNNIQDRIRPELFTCSFFDLESFMTSLGAIYEIEAINAAGLLPGVRLGYLMCDTCSHASKALQSVEHMLSIHHSPTATCGYIDFRPKVKMFLGALHSEVAVTVSRLLNVYMVPLMSSASSSPKLSDKIHYPVFLRTVPSDKHQMKAIAKLMNYYGWHWVGIVYEDGEYGRGAFQSFLDDAADSNVCLAYQEMLPHSENPSYSLQYIQRVSQQIISSSAQVVLLILRPELVEALFKEMIRTHTTRTWISSEAWSQSSLVSKMEGINMVGDILGLTFISHKSKAFDNYLTNLIATPGGNNSFIEEYKNLRFNCTPECFSVKPPPHCPPPQLLKIKSPNACNMEDPHTQNDAYLVNYLDTSSALASREAVWALAYALQKLLKCNSSMCSGELNFPPWKLLEELKKVKFTFENNTLFFDENGDFVSGYDLIWWEVDGNHRSFQKIGKYAVLDKQVRLTVQNVTWISTGNTTAPQSRCSKRCPPGSIKKILNVSCCYTCNPCHDGTYADKWDLVDCKKCPNGTWSLKGWNHCEPRWESYLKWSDPYPITLTTAASFGILLLIVILIIFLVHRDSPPMKRAEVRLSCVMIVGLAVSFASVICFMGKPTVYLCCARHLMYAMGFTLCVSCILVKAFRFFLAFLPFGQMTNRQLHKLYNPPVIVTIITALQVIICLLWMIFDSPYVEGSPPSPQSMKKILQCREGATYIGYGIMLGYIGLLALIGFLLAFKSRKVPHEFSETGYIIFSMLMYLFVWVCFIPVYITNHEEGTAVQASAILVSTYGIIFCHFLPKCYEALRKIKIETMETIVERSLSLTSDSTTDMFDPQMTISTQRTDSFSNLSTTTILGMSGYSSKDNAAASGLVLTPVPREGGYFPFFSNKKGPKLTKRCRSISL
ncbi:G-protein coupled receptor family C group 6 member A [Takifugu flavidus]|uniref:G-protein coupled receptor family C group 6 member A n=1 Tax=Takifugu flavidus TaxID=433684 RepID=UPI0025447720|nr:G-protein coupled receptor family C group 6 member A [Takifugu flavidus]